jgi:hypothetical protein
VAAAVQLIDDLDEQIAGCERELRRLGADHPYVSTLMTTPGIGWVLGYTIASEIGDITRFASAKKLVAYTGLCPRVYQSGGTDHRGPLAKNGPSTCAGRTSKPPPTPPATTSTGTATRQPKPGSAANAAPRSPASTSPAVSPKRTGTCSPKGNPSLRQVSRNALWSPDDPSLR